MLHPQVMEQIWARYSRARIRVQRKRSVRAVLLSAHSGHSPGHRRTCSRLAARAALRVSHTGLDTPHSRQSEGAQSHADPDSSTLAGRDISDAVRPALPAAGAQRLALAWRGYGVPPAPGATATVGLAREWLNLTTAGLLSECG